MTLITRINAGRYDRLLPEDRPRECDPTYTLDRQIADARKAMGEERWSALQAEWFPKETKNGS